MAMMFSSEQLHLPWFANERIGDVAHIIPLPPDPDRQSYRKPPSGRQRQPKQSPQEHPQQKPQDPAHKVDDYA